ncbi:MAG: ATP-binding protein [Balneolaceae bacterium]|nr:ATP-binding protein [Balneolaceae bacterium]
MNKAVTYRKKINASTQNLSDVREFVSRHAEKHGFTSRQVADVQLAVDEACTNIIKHAYNYDASKELSIELEFDDEKMNVTLTDQGMGFDVERYKKPDLKKQIARKKRGGMGVYLIRNLMDEVNYYAESRENVLRMIKNRN